MRKCLPALGEKPCPHCTANPSRADPSVWKDLPSREDGGLFFSPVPSSSHPEHYHTFLEMKAMKREGRLMKIVPDGCFSDLEFGRCDIEGCFYVFRYAIDRVRHLMLCHGATRKETNTIGFICKFKLPSGELCGFKAATQHYLNVHKSEEGHKMRVHSKKKQQPDQGNKKAKKRVQKKQAKNKNNVKQTRKKKNKPEEFLDNLSSEESKSEEELELEKEMAEELGKSDGELGDEDFDEFDEDLYI